MIGSESAAQEWLRQLPECDEVAWARLVGLVDLLREENLKQNLVSPASLAQVWQRHVVDSAQLLRFVPRETLSWLDLGTGAGFPGLVIAILRPKVQVTLVEARNRRIEWLRRVAKELGLASANVIGRPIERIAPEAYPVISARAFAPLDRLLALAARFSTKETLWLLPKGRSAAQELAALKGWRHQFHVEQSLTDAEASVIVGTLIGQDRLG